MSRKGTGSRRIGTTENWAASIRIRVDGSRGKQNLMCPDGETISNCLFVC